MRRQIQGLQDEKQELLAVVETLKEGITAYKSQMASTESKRKVMTTLILGDVTPTNSTLTVTRNTPPPPLLLPFTRQVTERRSLTDFIHNAKVSPSVRPSIVTHCPNLLNASHH